MTLVYLLEMLNISSEFETLFDDWFFAIRQKSGYQVKCAVIKQLVDANECSSISDLKKIGRTKGKQALFCLFGEFISNRYCDSYPMPVGQTFYLAGTFQNLKIVKK